MAMIAPTIEFPKDDVRALMHQMERARKVLGKDLKGSILVAMKHVVQSLAAATRVSKKFREYTEVGRSRSGKLIAYIVATKYRTPKRKGKALRRSWQGDWREQAIWAPNEAALKRRPAVIIAMRGLAAESWRAAGARNKFNMRKNSETSSGRNKAIMQKAARRWTDVEHRLTGDDPYIRVDNNLNYITQAINGGEGMINGAIGRAARAMSDSIERQAAKRMGAK
jgi:hypothetical protein